MEATNKAETTMSSESYNLSRVEQPGSYKAGTLENRACHFCGVSLKDLEVIIDVNDDEAAHVDCCLEAALGNSEDL
jgi:hypothetical protein